MRYSTIFGHYRLRVVVSVEFTNNIMVLVQASNSVVVSRDNVMVLVQVSNSSVVSVQLDISVIILGQFTNSAVGLV